MKQVLQNLRNGQTAVEEVPAPGLVGNQVLIQTTRSLISAGTERMLVEFGKASLIGKAKAQPDKVKQVIDKIKTDGLMPTLEAVFNRLDEPLPLGYCNAGVVLEVGAGVSEFKPGDRVASNGPHAEIVCIPKNLCAKIPESVSDEQAAFTVLSSIGLQGIRLAGPTLGEKFVVVGVGLIGLATIQLLRANGCDVLGVDMNADRLALAEKYGAKIARVSAGCDPVATVSAWTEGRGADAVLITASAKTDDIIHQAAEMCRKRGRIVLVGVIGLNLRRADFYEKELTFQVSCSYGPGRYDDQYEQGGVDYPLGFVRWTEQRNFEAILQSMASGQLKTDDLVTHTFKLEDATAAYEKVVNDPTALGIILSYAGAADTRRSIPTQTVQKPKAAGSVVAALVGSGNFSKAVMAPCLAKTKSRLKYVSARTNSSSAVHLASKYGFEVSTTNIDDILDDEEVNAVFISTRPNSHSSLACQALAAGKNVFVEKPMAITIEGLQRVIKAAINQRDRQYMVGFNRRFSPHIIKTKELLASRSEPLAMSYMVNAGAIPAGTWFHDRAVNGGRIIAEGCHFIDLLAFIAGSGVVSVSATQFAKGSAVKDDKMSILLTFEDGSIGTVNYFSNGTKSYPKEQLEIFSDQRVLRMDNYRKTTGYGFSGFKKFKTFRQDKGHAAEFTAFVDTAEKGGHGLIALEDMVNATLVSFAAVTSAEEHRIVNLHQEYTETHQLLSGGSGA